MQQAKSSSASDLFFHFFASGFPDTCRHRREIRSTSNPFRREHHGYSSKSQEHHHDPEDGVARHRR
jgi:hypothetical protein